MKAIVLLLLVLCLVLGYGWGRDHGRGSEWERRARSAQRTVDSLLSRADSADAVIADLTKGIEGRSTAKAKVERSIFDEHERQHDERKTLDTAGAVTLRRTLLWSNPH